MVTWLTCLFAVFGLAANCLADQRWVWVEAAVDGDTVRLRNGTLVRYLGIDAPEIDHRARLAEPFGDAALELNRRLVQGKRIRLQSGQRKYDRYGRLLAHPMDKDGRMINRLILRQGLAYYYPDIDKKARIHQSKLLAAQRHAMAEGLGIWSHPVKGQGPYIGNRRSLRFHTPLCPYGLQTKRSNRSAIRSRRDAHWQGYVPCRQCLDSSIKKGLKRR